jgi:glycopeptide antibiotics resistance protein
MRGVFEHYFTHCLDEFSSTVLTIAVLYALLAIIIGIFKGRELAYSLLLLGCCLLIMYLTVFSRSSDEDVKYYLLPFASYTRIANGDRFLLPQVIMNVVLFVPLGFLLKGALVRWGWRKVVSYGAMFSMIIESLQLVLHRGAAEVDDVIHNTLGCAIGVLLFKVFMMFKGL